MNQEEINEVMWSSLPQWRKNQIIEENNPDDNGGCWGLSRNGLKYRHGSEPMKEIIVKFSFPEESLEGYENCDDQLIIEDHLRGCSFDNVGYEIIEDEADAARLELERCLAEKIEIIHLARFLANAWAMIDDFVYKNCDGNALMKYPVIQGTRNQINLKKIGQQQFDQQKVKSAVDNLIRRFEMASPD